MKKDQAKETKVEVFGDWKNLSGPRRMGTLNVRHIRGSEIFSFEYETEWLSNPPSAPLDPDLQFFRGEIFPNAGQNQFGLFLDSSPDRWGRLLMRRRESMRARIENREEKKLYELDYLLGVHDVTRLGALRFRLPSIHEFLDHSRLNEVPPWTTLRELEEACRRLEEDDKDSPEFRTALNLILAPGSSLGGARPKASVQDQDGRLWIAKFPSRDDSVDSGAWEMVLHQLGKECGLNLPNAKEMKLASHQRTFMVQRFDRDDGKRIHFVSAMTMLGRKDGDSAEVGASYLEIAEFLLTAGAQPDLDLKELWKRIVFSVLVSNCDDHLRNHGFLLTNSGWVLSPAFDVNPDPNGNGLKLNISENDNAQSLQLLLSVAPLYRVKKEEAEIILIRTREIVRTWDVKASKMGISKQECQKVKRAFRLVNESHKLTV